MTDTATESGKLDIGQVISQTFSVIGRNFATFFVLSFLLSGLPVAILSYVQVSAIGGPGAGLDLNPAMIASWVVGGLGAIVTASVLQGTLVYATVQDMNGQKPNIGECLTTGFRAFLPLLAVSILFGLAIVGGMILLVVPGIMIGVAWCVCVPALVAERTSITGAFGRAGELTRNNRWRIFGLFLIVWIALVVVGGIVGAITGGMMLASADPMAAARDPIQVVLSVVVNTLSSLVTSTGIAVLYVELRRLREGAGPQWLADIFS
jgi:MFS family permease